MGLGPRSADWNSLTVERGPGSNLDGDIPAMSLKKRKRK